MLNNNNTDSVQKHGFRAEKKYTCLRIEPTTLTSYATRNDTPTSP